MADQTAVPTYAELMDRANRAEEKIVRLISEAERTEAVHDAVAETREFAAQLDLTDEPFIETYSVVELREVEGE